MENEEMTDQEIINTIGMAELPYILYELNKKYKNQSYQLIDIGGDCMFRIGETNVANVSYLATYIHFLDLKDNKLHLVGNVSWPYCLKHYFRLLIDANGNKQEVNLRDDGLDLAVELIGDIYEYRGVFELTLDIPKTSKYEIRFIYECNGIETYSNKINCMRFSPIADVLKNQYAFRDKWVVYVHGAAIVVEEATEEKVFQKELCFLETIANNENKSLRTLAFQGRKEKGKEIWLVFDRIDKADDNGEYFFRYISEMKFQGAEVYFVLRKESKDYDRVVKYGTIIEPLSMEHKRLHLMADYIFTSQLNGWGENPFGEDEEVFRDMYHEPKVVFLQHGVTKDNQIKWLNRYNQNLYSIVTSSNQETKAFQNLNYGYNENQIWQTGMPRFDYLKNMKSKYILIMPTWRRGLMEQVYDEESKIYVWKLVGEYEKSDYILKYRSLLKSRLLRLIAKLFRYRIAFVPHPIMQPFKEYFDIPDDIEVPEYNASWNMLFNESAIMITDYSSVAFDFAFLRKPILYYQFDEEDFFAGHTYSKGYFEYKKDGFGPVISDARELTRMVAKMLLFGGKMPKNYKDRVDRFYSAIVQGKANEEIIAKVRSGKQ